jgi:hypothetical protein
LPFRIPFHPTHKPSAHPNTGAQCHLQMVQDTVHRIKCRLWIIKRKIMEEQFSNLQTHVNKCNDAERHSVFSTTTFCTRCPTYHFIKQVRKCPDGVKFLAVLLCYFPGHSSKISVQHKRKY